MVGEALLEEALVAGTEELAGTRLGQEVLAYMPAGAHAVIPKPALNLFGEAGSHLAAALGSRRTAETIGTMFDYFSTPTTTAAMSAMEALPAEAMEPQAFKILTSDGFSPNFGRNLQWSLPKLEDGKWIPGKWMDVSGQPFGMNGLYISDDAQRWLSYYGKSGRPPVTAFRVQIGDLPSRELWHNPISGMDRSNFTAKTIRLLEPVTGK
ncbi:MAG TPA: hypothetical protein V6D22_02000 [Candidatus Obscuribacterales bacterium]